MGEPDRADLLIGVAAIADFLGYTRNAAQHLINTGRLPVFRIGDGSKIHARRSSLNAWIDQLEREAADHHGDGPGGAPGEASTPEAAG